METIFWTASAAGSVALAAGWLAFKRPRIFLRVEEFTRGLCFPLLLVSGGALLGGYLTRDAVKQLTADRYGFSAPITTEGGVTEDGDNTAYILGTITSAAEHRLNYFLWVFGVSGALCLIGQAGAALAKMELDELAREASGTKPEKRSGHGVD